MVWVVAIIVGLIVGLSVTAASRYYQGLMTILSILGAALGFWLFYYVFGFRVFSFFFGGGIYLDAILWSLLGSLVLMLVGRLFMPDEEYVGRGVTAHEYRSPRRRVRRREMEEHVEDDDDDDDIL